VFHFKKDKSKIKNKEKKKILFLYLLAPYIEYYVTKSKRKPSNASKMPKL
jgi:hypothetical protein